MKNKARGDSGGRRASASPRAGRTWEKGGAGRTWRTWRTWQIRKSRAGGGHLARAATPANQLQLAHSVMTDAPDVPLHAILAVVSQKSLPAESLGLLVSGGVNKEMRR